MHLLDEIIHLSTEAEASLSVVLRKLLVLSYKLRNDRLKEWVSSELDGYGSDQELPIYRSVNAVAKGLFVGSFGSIINDQPLASMLLDPDHRHFAQRVELRDPIASYEKAAAELTSSASIAWPPNLTVYYQTKFFEDYALNRAWQEIPKSVFVAIVDTVRNRTLRFALELNHDLGEIHDEVQALPPAKVDQTVNTYIYGGHVVIAGTTGNITQAGNVVVSGGDIDALKSALASLGLGDAQIAELQTALSADGGGDPNTPSMGRRVSKWLQEIGKAVVENGAGIVGEALRAEARKYVMQFVGLS